MARKPARRMARKLAQHKLVLDRQAQRMRVLDRKGQRMQVFGSF